MADLLHKRGLSATSSMSDEENFRPRVPHLHSCDPAHLLCSLAPPLFWSAIPWDLAGRHDAQSRSQCFVQECRMLIDIAVSKAQMEFETKLKDHRIHVDQRFSSLEEDIDMYHHAVDSRAAWLKQSCDTRAGKSQSELEKMKVHHEELNDKSNATVEKTQFTIAKIAGGVVAGVALVFILDKNFCTSDGWCCYSEIGKLVV